MDTPEDQTGNTIDTKRRNLLKLALFGGGAFVLGKVFGPSLQFFSKESSIDPNSDTQLLFKNFRVNENGEELAIYDKLGNEIFIIEKE